MNGLSSTLDATAEPAPDELVPVRVWDLPTRVFHWSLVVSFSGAWLSAESERWRDLHLMFGYTLAGLLVFRLLWGVIGSRYARFSSFSFPPSRLASYLKSLWQDRPEQHLGHNPAGALAIFGLLILGATVAASGYATYRELGGEDLEDLHEVAANVMLGLVFIHLLGVAVSSFLHRENLVRSMLTGWKRGRSGEGITRSYRWPGVLLLLAIIGFWGVAQSPAGRDFMLGTANWGETGRPRADGAAGSRAANDNRHDRGQRERRHPRGDD